MSTRTFSTRTRTNNTTTNTKSINTIQSNVLSIILSYIKPQNLQRIFKSHKLDYGQKFKHNALNREYVSSDVRKIYDNFPNVILKGLNTSCVLKQPVSQICTSLNKVRVLILRFESFDYSAHINIFTKCPNVVRLTLQNHYTCNTAFIEKNIRMLNKLKHIKLIQTTSVYLLSLHNCQNLRTIEIINIHLNEDYAQQLTQCSNLNYLKLTSCTLIKTCDVYNACFKQLKRLKILNCSNHTINSLFSCQYDKLESLSLEWKNSGTYYVPCEIRSVKIPSSSIGQTKTLERLKIKYYEISDISDIDDLFTKMSSLKYLCLDDVAYQT